MPENEPNQVLDSVDPDSLHRLGGIGDGGDGDSMVSCCWMAAINGLVLPGVWLVQDSGSIKSVSKSRPQPNHGSKEDGE